MRYFHMSLLIVAMLSMILSGCAKLAPLTQNIPNAQVTASQKPLTPESTSPAPVEAASEAAVVAESQSSEVVEKAEKDLTSKQTVPASDASTPTTPLVSKIVEKPKTQVPATQTATGIPQPKVEAETPTKTPRYVDGAYYGEAQGYKGVIKVEVLVSGGKISAIKVVEHNDTGAFAEQAFMYMRGLVLDGQTTQVDTLSGATKSSKGYLDAINNANLTIQE